MTKRDDEPGIGGRGSQSQWRQWYDFLSGDEPWSVDGVERTGKDLTEWRFINWGYEPSDPAGALTLRPEDESERSGIALYNHLATHTPIDGKDLIEVGSGRGGGCDFLARYFKPRSVIGFDFSPKAVEFCRAQYQSPALEYRVGDALALPLPDDSVDVVFNVESSHCYDSVEGFVKQVKRVLRPGGRFLLTDLRTAKDLPGFIELLRAHFAIDVETDITSNVVASMTSRAQRPVPFSSVPVFQSKLASEKFADLLRARGLDTPDEEIDPSDFQGKVGGRPHRMLSSREWLYYSFAMTKR